MTSRNLTLVALLAVFGLAAYFALGRSRLPSAPQASTTFSTAPALGEDSALANSHHLPVRPSAVAAFAARRATLFGEYSSARSYRGLYDRLRNSAEGATAEGLYVTYSILRACATVTDRPAGVQRGNSDRPLAQRRQEFLAALQPNDPDRDKRLAAFEKGVSDKCAGFEDVKTTQADLDKLLDQSAQAGDPKAQASQVQRDVWQARRNGQWRTATLNDAQVGTLEQTLSSKDPEAMRLAGQLLSDPWPDVTVHLGASGEAVEPHAFYNAWQMLACDYGSACGDDSQRVLEECAYSGHCDASSLPDYLYYYASTPHESDLMMRYENELRAAVENNDWSQLQVTHGPRMPNATVNFRRTPG